MKKLLVYLLACLIGNIVIYVSISASQRNFNPIEWSDSCAFLWGIGIFCVFIALIPVLALDIEDLYDSDRPDLD